MKQALVYKLLSLLSKLTGKFFFYITPSKHNSLGKTAVEDSMGVWYVGNVYDKNDITYGISQNGYVEKEETELLTEIIPLIKPTSGDLSFYDIGANIGYYGLLVAKKYGAQVQSFEPLPEFAECIEKSCILNGITSHLKVNKIALSDKKDVVEFTKAGSGSSLEKTFNELPDLEKISVNTDTLDNVSKVNNFIAPHFIKIDVEGHELSVLKGGAQVISDAKPVIFIELCTTLKDIGRSYTNPYYQDTLSFFEQNSYEMYLIRDNKKMELWSKEKTIDRAGMFLCLNKNTHKTVLDMIEANYKVIK